eukprot:CAMPEP_0184478706 /NCGR_PEP_ID=MMETSP0113_2-20130426/663_1 /TAXON_ID=91329 /ORGANISM="Norrisiella sphaerica, Strain BC52" /LENGTH=480 /DNA_ID=CAMNT_0026856593 /DNA_START=124 /DNA_END=1566 /DNA_ORIENTATION=+
MDTAFVKSDFTNSAPGKNDAKVMKGAGVPAERITEKEDKRVTILNIGVLMKPSKADKFTKRLASSESGQSESESESETEDVKEGVHVSKDEPVDDRVSKTKCVYKKLDPNVPLNKQGPIDILLMKPNDWCVRSYFHGDMEAAAKIKEWNEFTQEHRRNMCTIGNPDESLKCVLDRGLMIKVLKEIEYPKVNVPRTIRITATLWRDHQPVIVKALQDLKYPVIAKNIIACGETDSHRMTIAPSPKDIISALAKEFPQEERERPRKAGGEDHGASSSEGKILSSDVEQGLWDPERWSFGFRGWIVQEMIQHNGVVHKVYLLGNSVYVSTNASIPKTLADGAAHSWHSHSACPKSQTREADEGEAKRAQKQLSEMGRSANKAVSATTTKTLVEEMKFICKAVSLKMSLSAIGIDIIVATNVTREEGQAKSAKTQVRADTGENKSLYVVDVNFLPSYEPLSDATFRRRLQKLLMECKAGRLDKE